MKFFATAMMALALATPAQAAPSEVSLEDLVNAYAAAEAAETGAQAYQKEYAAMYRADPIRTIIEDVKMAAPKAKPAAKATRVALATSTSLKKR